MVFWYGFDSEDWRKYAQDRIKQSIASHGLDSPTSRMWAGEINVVSMEGQEPVVDIGLRGCGIICANLSQEALDACTNLAGELVRIYTSAVLPSGQSGAIQFSSVESDLGRR